MKFHSDRQKENSMTDQRSDFDRLVDWHDFIGRDLDPDIAERPMLRHAGHEAERLLLQAVRDLKAMRAIVESKTNY